MNVSGSQPQLTALDKGLQCEVFAEGCVDIFRVLTSISDFPASATETQALTWLLAFQLSPISFAWRRRDSCDLAAMDSKVSRRTVAVLLGVLALIWTVKLAGGNSIVDVSALVSQWPTYVHLYLYIY